MKRVVIINKSDTTGGAAVVSYRLLRALRQIGVNAKMLVAEKLTDDPDVLQYEPQWRLKKEFLTERLDIFVRNRFNRKTLFQIDTGRGGVPLSGHPAVKEADAIFLGWVNQGLLSLDEIGKMRESGKRILWTMHDMWNFTGICHHAGNCPGYLFNTECGSCPLLAGGPEAGNGTGSEAGRLNSETKRLKRDLSTGIQKKKAEIYGEKGGITFVAVSRWLAQLAKGSLLLNDQEVAVIPNPFELPERREVKREKGAGTVRIVMGAARLDDQIKGLPTLMEATRILAERYPERAKKLELITFGEVKKGDSFDGIGIRHIHLGRIEGAEKLRQAYEECDVVVSPSSWETLPGTLVEGMAYGCVPVAFDRGGQRDIVDHLETGYIVPWDDDLEKRAAAFAEGILWGVAKSGEEIRERMYKAVAEKFSATAVAKAYMKLAFPYEPE